MIENIVGNRFDVLHDKISAEMERLGVPGVALGIIIDGRAHTAGFGVTSIENPLAVDGDTLFQIGSTTKDLYRDRGDAPGRIGPDFRKCSAA